MQSPPGSFREGAGGGARPRSMSAADQRDPLARGGGVGEETGHLAVKSPPPHPPPLLVLSGHAASLTPY